MVKVESRGIFYTAFVGIPHWFLALLLIGLAYLPWLPWKPLRFSVRTLLIVTTLVAVVLGLVVWMTR